MSERTLAVELVGVLAIETVAGVRQDGIPKPSRYVGAMIAFGMLAALAAVGPAEARLASAFGGVVVLGILLSPTPDGTKAQSVAKGLGVAASSGLPPGTRSSGINAQDQFVNAQGVPVQQGPPAP